MFYVVTKVMHLHKLMSPVIRMNKLNSSLVLSMRNDRNPCVFNTMMSRKIKVLKSHLSRKKQANEASVFIPRTLQEFEKIMKFFEGY